MKTKLITALLVLSVLINFSARSDEGMWLPLHIKRLNYEKMKEMGCNLTPEEIYSVNGSSIKDAIALMDNISTGTVISNDGLLMASHSFGLKYIRANSSTKNDYLTDGFWAMNKSEELPNAGLTASFLIRIEDVTGKILPKLKDNMTEEERMAVINSISKKIENKAIGKTHYNAKVKSFYQGKEFYLFVYETFRDVRLVGAPPEAIGRYGGDSDNWRWPRNTGDFTLFRVYTGTDGKPADYSENNIPYKPKKSLTITLDGIQENDFTMLMGYPIKTFRYITSHNVKMAQEISNPTIIKIKGEKISILNDASRNNDDVRIKYASKLARTSNVWKYYVGQRKQINRFNVYDKKLKQEKEFQIWAEANPKRKAKYGNILSDIESSFDKISEYNKCQHYFNELIVEGTDVISMAYNFLPIYNDLKAMNGNQEAKDYKIPDELIESVKDYAVTTDFPTDNKVFIALFKMIEKDIPIVKHPEILSLINTEYSDNFEWFANDIYRSSLFADIDKLWQFINNPDYKVLENDHAFRLLLSFYDKNNSFEAKLENAKTKYSKASRLYVEGLMEMDTQKEYYPDANTTMRISYGKVSGYFPMDGLIGKPYTTLYGVMEKEDPDNKDYKCPDKLKQLFKDKDYGIYSKSSIMNTCFITDTDVTGGNSGSPVLNKDGQIVGFVFDKNWEGMSGDIIYEENYQRTINVDIRYILFIIDKYAGAGYLVDEMNIDM